MLKGKHNVGMRDTPREEYLCDVHIRAVVFNVNLVVEDVAVNEDAVNAAFVQPSDLQKFVMTLLVIANHLRANILNFRNLGGDSAQSLPNQRLGISLFYPSNYLLSVGMKYQQAQRFILNQVASFKDVEMFVIRGKGHGKIQDPLRIIAPQQTPIQHILA